MKPVLVTGWSGPVRILDRPVYLIYFPVFMTETCSKLLVLNAILYRIYKKILVEVDYVNYHYPKIESVLVKISDRPVCR